MLGVSQWETTRLNKSVGQTHVKVCPSAWRNLLTQDLQALAATNQAQARLGGFAPSFLNSLAAVTHDSPTREPPLLLMVLGRLSTQFQYQVHGRLRFDSASRRTTLLQRALQTRGGVLWQSLLRAMWVCLPKWSLSSLWPPWSTTARGGQRPSNMAVRPLVVPWKSNPTWKASLRPPTHTRTTKSPGRARGFVSKRAELLQRLVSCCFPFLRHL